MKYILLFLFVPILSSAQTARIFTSLDEAMKEPEKVIHLDLSKQKLKEFPLEILNFPNLEVLNLSKNRISLIPSGIGELIKLKVLDLSKNKFSILPPQIGKLKNLRILNLEKNKIDQLPEEIGLLENLEVLNLWKNSVSNFPAEMGNLKLLEKIDLRGTIIPEEELGKLKESLPNTNILYTSGCYCGYGVLRK